MYNAHIFGKLLLAVHVSFGTGHHDPGVHRTASQRAVPNARVPQPLRVHGPDDHEQESRDLGSEEVRSDAQLGQEQDQIQQIHRQ